MVPGAPRYPRRNFELVGGHNSGKLATISHLLGRVVNIVRAGGRIERDFFFYGLYFLFEKCI